MSNANDWLSNCKNKQYSSGTSQYLLKSVFNFQTEYEFMIMNQLSPWGEGQIVPWLGTCLTCG